MSKYILTCSCFGMKKKASEAFNLLFPNEVLPPIIKGRDRIYQFSNEVGNDHIKAISKLSGKYAYYIEIDGRNILEWYNLLTGKRIG